MVRALLLLLVACKGGSSGVTVVDEGTGDSNAVPLQPLTPGQTWQTGDVLVRVGETFSLAGRELVRVTTSEGGALSDLWMHRDTNGIWLDGSAADGLLDTPILVVPEPVRAGLRWEQHFKGDQASVTGWIERDPDDPTRWVVNRQQGDHAPTTTPYREGFGPHTPLFVPSDPPVPDTVPEARTLSGVLLQGTTPYLEAVGLEEDGYGSRGGALLTQVVYDPQGQLGPREEVVTTGLYSLPGEFPTTVDEVEAYPGRPFGGLVDDGYLTTQPPWATTEDVFVPTEAGWMLRDLVVPQTSWVRLDEGPVRWFDAHADGTVDVLEVEGTAFVRRRLGRLELEGGRHLRSAWYRADGVLEGVVSTADGPLDGEAERFVLPVDLAESVEVPARPYVRAIRWDHDVEVCWTGGGTGSDWSLDGLAPAAVVDSGPGCVLLVRDLAGLATAPPYGGELTGSIDGVGPFWVQVDARTQAQPLGGGERRRQTDGTVVDLETRSVVRPGNLFGGALVWPERCIPDALEGCWLLQTVAGGTSIAHLGPDGRLEAGTVDGFPTNPGVAAAGGLILPGAYGTYERLWVRPDGVQETLPWQASGFLPESFDGTSACHQPAGDIGFVCADVQTGEERLQLARADIDVAYVRALPDGDLLVWPYTGAARVVDRSTWTVTLIAGDLTGAHVGGVLADGTVWGWRSHPTVSGDRQLVRIRDGQAEVASFPVDLGVRASIVEGTQTGLLADEELVYWVGSQPSPSPRSSSVRVPWSALTWEVL